MKGMMIDAQLCRQCRGRCCQGHPGVWSNPQRFFSLFTGGAVPQPEDFGQLLRQHRLTLRDLGGVLVPAPQNTESGCSAQTADGCAYPAANRPCQCLALIPSLETLLDDQIHCSLPPAFGSGTARENWRPYQAILAKVQNDGPAGHS